MDFLRRQLDDPETAACGRCDNCTGQRWSAEVSETDAAQARERLRRPGVEVAPRKMWPTGMKALGFDLSGKIPPGQLAEPGRALGRLTDIGWGNRLRRLFAEDAPDGPVPSEVFDAIVKVLAAWDWAERPAGIVSMGSRSRPELILSLSERLSQIGRLPYLGEVAVTGPAVPRRHNSAQRLASVAAVLSVPDSLRSALSEVQGPILLIDDRIDTGWTMTVATRLLRGAGAPSVLPLALATTS
jgi:ATP-dependent DNA helicase RecQ